MLQLDVSQPENHVRWWGGEKRVPTRKSKQTLIKPRQKAAPTSLIRERKERQPQRRVSQQRVQRWMASVCVVVVPTVEHDEFPKNRPHPVRGGSRSSCSVHHRGGKPGLLLNGPGLVCCMATNTGRLVPVYRRISACCAGD